jgi:hypothetical protein
MIGNDVPQAEAIGYDWNGKQDPGERRMKSIPVLLVFYERIIFMLRKETLRTAKHKIVQSSLLSPAIYRLLVTAGFDACL